MKTLGQLLDAKGHTIHCVEPELPVLEALRVMAEHHVGALLVMQGNELQGILSERDYARKVVLMGRSSSETPVWQIMSSPVVSVLPEASLQDAMRMMTEKRIRHLPVLSGTRVVGIVSIGDLVKSMLEDQRKTISELESYIHGS
ncbi:MAG: CBS domain-containing protein [Steroidobacteraceae bacterium]